MSFCLVNFCIWLSSLYLVFMYLLLHCRNRYATSCHDDWGGISGGIWRISSTLSFNQSFLVRVMLSSITLAFTENFSIVFCSDSLPTTRSRARITGSLSTLACSNSFLAFNWRTLDHFSPWGLVHVKWRDARRISLYSLRLSLETDVDIATDYQVPTKRSLFHGTVGILYSPWHSKLLLSELLLEKRTKRSHKTEPTHNPRKRSRPSQQAVKASFRAFL